jgi:hypothetical protein
MIFSEHDINKVATLLGRQPRGLKAIPVRSLMGDPVVIQVAPLVNQKPFPTVFWLVDKAVNYTIDQLEASGFIDNMQIQIDQSSTLQASLVADHQRHIALRWSLMSTDEQQKIDALGFSAVFQQRGIGGIENFNRIRCLHTYYAAHLIETNTIGNLLDHYWQSIGKTFPHLSANPHNQAEP